MFRIGGAWYHEDVALDVPSEDHLCSCLAMSSCDSCDDRICKKLVRISPSSKRIPGLYDNALATMSEMSSFSIVMRKGMISGIWGLIIL